MPPVLDRAEASSRTQCSVSPREANGDQELGGPVLSLSALTASIRASSRFREQCTALGAHASSPVHTVLPGSADLCTAPQDTSSVQTTTFGQEV